jgi:crotonobetainyl-CoA:carnitine CoA-transferase CaiB-like acyl-CoA transferase
LGRLGVDFETLRAANPQIILLSLSSQGLEGPEAGFISFGSPLEALGGSMAITGYHPDEPPVWTGNNVNYPDQLVSYLAPGLALAALRARNHTGQAIHVDAAQREAVTSVVGEAVVEYSATGTVPRPIGNRHPGFAPQGVYPAIGDDEWVAISVQTDDEWQALISVDGLGKLRDDPTLAALEQRRHRHDYIDEVLADFTSTQDSAQLANDLQSLGVPASRVTRPRDVLHHPQLQALGFHQRVLSEPIIQRGFIARFSHTPAHISRQAPRLGEHTREVLQERLGYDEARIQGLQGSGAIYCEEHAEATPL